MIRGKLTDIQSELFHKSIFRYFIYKHCITDTKEIIEVEKNDIEVTIDYRS